MTPHKRILTGLFGLIALVLVVWLARGQGGDPTPAPTSGAAATASATAGASTSRGQGAVPGAESGLPVKPLSQLPKEADQTWRLVERGGPFPYPEKDGSVFGNFERRLPGKGSGYYKEYTVPTPGERDRGARRLVTGGGGEVYYTGDHYGSFVVVDTKH
ncbi:Guanyl-specific ribonuclease Sa [Streptoalloteichus tenebrarius]|uniref:Guanyl-specific ribonuclease Sa n=1 Tax=Streptoalloteichus tenebrarius (strain ATCC 17920 / DSM 40477 / JCM 4838 / CBS 697.72 / NBRC 16177 / NCIMB 11028 / NRRL B-12390 / A12253. 1 / ISP 5477) TaxID=1933 RepID=A0ABT1HZ92_STRSD|nr:ribonuclease domain-containing protein [Streptoalloteichus tenebrarius]MCP2260831.1 Guanyl-specific ribonuclease Sa [Streptoalloteichus tenebrarius]BFF00495.1 ribonuclease domain-containing protein [Streptoalloteichus tenebrarius]